MRPAEQPLSNLAEENERLKTQVAALQAQSERLHARYRTLMGATAQVVWLADTDGNLLESPGWCRFTGLSPEAASGYGWLDSIHPDDRERTAQAWNAAVAGEKTYEVEYRVRRHDGTYHWFVARGNAVIADDGTIVEWIGASRNIEAEKRTLESLLRSQHDLAEAQAIAHVGSWTWDLVTDRAIWSAEMFRIFNIPPRDVITGARKTLDTVVPEDRPKVEAALQASLSTGSPYNVDYRMVLPDGSTRAIHVRAHAILDEAGRPVLMKGTLQDITERKHIEDELRNQNARIEREVANRTEALQKSRAMLAEAQHLSHIGSWELDVATLELTWSDEQYRLFGIDPSTPKVLRSLATQRVHPDDFEHHESVVKAALERGQAFTMDYRVVHPDGRILDIHSIGRPVFDAEGRVVKLHGTSQDVTERSRLEAQLRAQYDQLMELDHLKNNFVNSVTHELRTPLTSIVGYAEFLEDEIGGPVSPQQLEFILQIQRGAKRLEYLLNDLLDFARLEAGTFTLKLEMADLADKVREVVESFKPQADETRTVIETRLPPEPLASEMDPQRIGQVLTNLISNAIKFAPVGTGIQVNAWQVDGALRCEIHDAGPGIVAEDLPKLFQRFVQLEAGIRMGKGAGLGLSISKALIEAHGGAIGVESTPGVGSTFWFTIPLKQDPV